MSRVDGSEGQLFEEASFTDPSNVQLRLMKGHRSVEKLSRNYNSRKVWCQSQLPGVSAPS